MIDIKETLRVNVRFGFDGYVYKSFSGPWKQERFENETRVLRFLEACDCHFVPRLIELDEDSLSIVTTHCGDSAPNISAGRLDALFLELEGYGVKHGDPFPRNVTYNARSGRFNVIDFEYATILATGEGFTIADDKAGRRLAGPN